MIRLLIALLFISFPALAQSQKPIEKFPVEPPATLPKQAYQWDGNFETMRQAIEDDHPMSIRDEDGALIIWLSGGGYIVVEQGEWIRR